MMPRAGENLTNPDIVSKKIYGSGLTYGLDTPRILLPEQNGISSTDLVQIAGTAEPGLHLSRIGIWIYLSDDETDSPINSAQFYAEAYDEPYLEGSLGEIEAFFDKGYFHGLQDLTVGERTLYARAQNEHDNVLSGATPFTFTRDNVHPTVIVATIATNDKIVKGTASDVGSTIERVYITLAGASAYGEDPYSDFDASVFDANLTLEEDGTYTWAVKVETLVLSAYNTISVTAVDAGGRSTTIITAVLYETVAPVISSSREYYNSGFLFGTYEDLTTAEQPIASGIKEILVNKQEAVFENGWWTVDLSIFGDGRYTIKMEIWDIAGNYYSVEREVFIVYAVPSGIINVSEMNEHQSVYYTNLNNISGKFHSNSASLLISVKLNGTELLTENVYNGAFSVNDILSEGFNIVTLDITNKAGTRIVITESIFYDITAPVLLKHYLVEVNQIELVFDEMVKAETLFNKKAYQIIPTGLIDTRAQELFPVDFVVEEKSVIVTLDRIMLPQQNYSMAVRGIQDLAGNAI